MTIAKVLIWMIRIVEWSFVWYSGLFLYRTFRFPSLPWLGAYFLAHWVPKMLIPFIMAIFFKTSMFRDDVVKASVEMTKTTWPKAQAVIGIADWVSLLGKISYLLITLLVVSEVIYMIGTKTALKIPKSLELTLAIRRNVTLVGMLVVLMTLFSHVFSTVALYKMLF